MEKGKNEGIEEGTNQIMKYSGLYQEQMENLKK